MYEEKNWNLVITGLCCWRSTLFI